MIRKSLIALAAIATLSASALAPTAASAKFGGFKGGFKLHHGHHFHGHRHFGRIGLYGVTEIGGDCYWAKKLTRWGTIRLVKVCTY